MPTINPAFQKTPWGWALAGALVGLVLAVILYAPARWLTAAVQQGTQGRVVFQDARGTIWNGSAQLALAGGEDSPDSATLPGRLAWRLRPKWSGLLVELNADCCMQRPWNVSLQPRWGGFMLALSDSQSYWPAQLLTGLGTPWNTVQIEGQLTLSTRRLMVEWAVGRMAISGSAQLDAAQITSRLSTLRPLGSYRITLSGGAAPTFTVETLNGGLQLNGTGQWAGSRFRFEGVAGARPEQLDALANILNILGRRDGARSIIKVG
jgi:general secretion pathway protein N